VQLSLFDLDSDQWDMSLSDLFTVEQFLTDREELPDGGRWTEVLAGRLVMLQPPTIEHGTAVLNLSKALAEFTQHEPGGYACFELGLIVARNPDTLQFPAVSFFVEGPRFAEADKIVTETRPALVTEVASTNDRRRAMRQRVTGWWIGGCPSCGCSTRRKSGCMCSSAPDRGSNWLLTRPCLAERRCLDSRSASATCSKSRAG